MRLSRRKLLKAGVAMGAAGMVAGPELVFGDRDDDSDSERRGDDDGDRRTGLSFMPFEADMPVPEVLQPTLLSPAPGSPQASLGSTAVFHGIAPEFHPDHPAHCSDWNQFSAAPAERHYALTMQRAMAEIIPGVETEVFGYNGQVPGPTIVARFREPIVVRQTNTLDFETSVHLHGGHTPAHADGFPNFYVLPGRARDYYYPNIAPRKLREGCEEEFEISEVPSTMWYHDHGMDLTGHNVSRGLAGFYLLTDDVEDELIARNVLPPVAGEFDIPIALQDQRFRSDGSLAYDFFDHDGRLGDVFTANGKAQPKLHVQRRKYRFRLLNASNARVYHLRLSSRRPFLMVGTDSWLLPQAHALESFTLAPSERQDVIVDFSEYSHGEEIFLENLMEQDDGRGPEEINPSRRTPLIKFIADGGSVTNDLNIEAGTPLREHVPIREEEIVVTRKFEFERGNGAWQVNGRFFSPRRADAVPRLGGAERWILENDSGGWWHPIHIHLESHHIQRLDGKRPPFHRRFKVDVSTLRGDGVSEVFVKFRTFTGPFVFHCHNLEHEDMRMMGVFDPRPAGEKSVFNGVREAPQEISGIPDGFDVESELAVEHVADLEPLEDEGVGFPAGDFKRGGQTTPPAP